MIWVAVCPLDRIVVDRGVAALIDGEPVAVFRTAGDALFAVDHREPFTGMPVMARGLVGSSGEIPTVASPLHKQRFDLRTGICLDVEGCAVRTWPVKVVDGTVMVAPTCSETGSLARARGQGPALDEHQVTLVKQSFALVEPIAERVAELFHTRLFHIAPDVVPLFRGDMAEQGSALMRTLSAVVAGLDDFDSIIGTVSRLGERHVGYGVRPEHYASVGEALLWTLDAGLGPAFTPEVEASWAVAYGVLADAMIEAAGHAPS